MSYQEFIINKHPYPFKRVNKYYSPKLNRMIGFNNPKYEQYKKDIKNIVKNSNPILINGPIELECEFIIKPSKYSFLTTKEEKIRFINNVYKYDHIKDVDKSFYQHKHLDSIIKELCLKNVIMPTNKQQSDIDNLLKAVSDSLNTILYDDDSQIIKISGIKKYGKNPRVIIKIKKYEN